MRCEDGREVASGWELGGRFSEAWGRSLASGVYLILCHSGWEGRPPGRRQARPPTSGGGGTDSGDGCHRDIVSIFCQSDPRTFGPRRKSGPYRRPPPPRAATSLIAIHMVSVTLESGLRVV